MKKRKKNPNQYARMSVWQKQNMKSVIAKYKSDFVDDFREACVKLGISQSDVIRKAMQKTIIESKKVH